MIQFLAQQIEEPITKQYLDTCPQNATYISNTSAELLLDAMNFYFETKNFHSYVLMLMKQRICPTKSAF